MKPSKEFFRRKKQSRWHWNYHNDKPDSEMFKIIGNVQGKWPRLPKRTHKNKLVSSNPSVIAQQGKFGIQVDQIYTSTKLDKKSFSQYKKFVDPIGLEDIKIHLQDQVPGQMTVIHMDTARSENEYLDNNGQPLSEKQRRERLVTCFIMLDDWYPGQVMLMGSHHWVRWKKGDIMYFNWQHLPHGTANFGHNLRPMLFVRGIATDKFRKILKSKSKLKFKV